uniref:serine--tRNA ligase n=1 Tax=Glossina pallidipes TaxID=7398 RepID=A0A1B0A9V9_GLOPL
MICLEMRLNGKNKSFPSKVFSCPSVRKIFASVRPLTEFDSNAIGEHDLHQAEKNILLRRRENNIPNIRNILKRLKLNKTSSEDIDKLKNELLKLPNDTHPRLWTYENRPKETLLCDPTKIGTNYVEFSQVCKFNNMLRMNQLGNYTGQKSYYLFGKLAELEQALIRYTLSVLKQKQFRLLAVPDILPKHIIEGCGMATDGDRNQKLRSTNLRFSLGTSARSKSALAIFTDSRIACNALKSDRVQYIAQIKLLDKATYVYKLDSGDCLSGTSEMSLAGYFSNKLLEENNLPIKVAAVSRCYRAETSGLQEEKGIYRVHQFTKVEMFSICSELESHEMLQHFKDIEIEIFKSLNLHLRLLDMPPTELGASAYEKYDLEAWMPGRQMWGEISSCSNCTDYQAKRLNIKYVTNEGQNKWVNTINGTATAIPRLLIALLESNQKGTNLLVPDVLKDYLNTSVLTKEKSIPEVKLVKQIKSKE